MDRVEREGFLEGFLKKRMGKRAVGSGKAVTDPTKGGDR